MFKKLKIFSENQIAKKILATTIVLTLTFANIILLGSYLTKGLISYASGINLANQDSSTNNANVKFEVYLDNDKNKNQTNEDISSTGLKLYTNISVENGGFLRNAKIEFINTNFVIKGIEDNTYDDIPTIQAGVSREFNFTLESLKIENFNLGLLNTQSQIKLTGTYINNSNQEISIDSDKYVEINWIPAVNIESELIQNVITNKIYSINGVNKKVIQLEIISNIQDNSYPVKETALLLSVPDIQATAPEQVIVTSYGTNATNGKGLLDFGIKDNDGNETNDKLSTWEYNATTKQVNIITKNPASDSNTVSWIKNSEDKFIVTYIYPASITTSFTSVIASTTKLYDTTNTEITKQSTITHTNMAEVGNGITLITSGSDVIYKGNMNMTNPTNPTKYNIEWNIGVGCSSIADGIAIGNDLDTLNIANVNSYYEYTYIDKAEMLKILGENGTIGIYNAETMGLIVEINKDTVTEENGDIKVIYASNIKSIIALISDPISEGELVLSHEKALNTNNYTPEQISQINTLTSPTALTANQGETEIVSEAKLLSINVEETTTEAAISIDKTNLSTSNVNNVKFTVTLKADDIKYDLYKNPTFEIELPACVNNINVNDINITPEDSGLTFNEESLVVENNKIQFALTGEQTQYNTNVQIVLDVNITTTKLMPSQIEEIELNYMNGKDTKYIDNQANGADVLNVNFESEKGILLENSISNYNGIEPEVSAFIRSTGEALGNLADSAPIKTINLRGTIINNNNENLTGIKVLGRMIFEGNKSLAEGTNLGSTINTMLTSEIIVRNQEGTLVEVPVYYSDNAEATTDLSNGTNGWTQTRGNNTKSYLIDLGAVNDKEVLVFSYNVEIPENLEINKFGYLTYAVYNNSQIVESPKIGLKTPTESALELTTTATVAEGVSIYEGQNITYTINVKNIGNSVANNIVINNPIPSGTTAVSGTATSWNINSLAVGQTETRTIEVTVGAIETLENTTTVTADYLPQTLTRTIQNPVLEKLFNIESQSIYGQVFYEGDEILHEITITNVSSEVMNNVIVKIKTPEDTQYIAGMASYSWDEINKEATCNLGSMQPGEIVTFLLTLKTIPTEIGLYEKNITYKISITSENNDEYKEDISRGVIVKPNLELTLTSPTANQEIALNEEVEYNITVENKGNYAHDIKLKDVISDGMLFKSASYTLNNITKNIEASTGQPIYLNETILAGQTLTLHLEFELGQMLEEIINNVNIYVNGHNFSGFGSIPIKVFEKEAEMINTVEIPTPDPEDPDPEDPDPEDPDPEDPDPEDPDPEVQTYIISGKAWLDENKNGARETGERLLNNIVVKIVDRNTNKFIKDTEGYELQVKTDLQGNYQIPKLPEGEYILVFEFNDKLYSITKYKKDGVSTTVNSDAITTTIDEISTTKTDPIIINNANINNIDIGLVSNPTFDLKLDKSITKVTLQNTAGTIVYNYNNEHLAKLEIRAKNLPGSLVIIEYTINVTNEGDAIGYAKNIVDYISPDLKFSSELNTNWYQNSDGKLYCTQLANEAIASGETKTVKLILTKTMTEKNIGIVNNSAEVYEDYNIYALEDKDSTPANNSSKEDDYSEANILITVRTGSTTMYIGIILLSMSILGSGIYLINKKVLNRK